MPEALLKNPVEEMGLDEFTRYLAKARYLEEVETRLHINALAALFEDK